MTHSDSIRHFLFSQDSWLWRPNRRLLYWITTVALICSVGQVIWDLADINLQYRFGFKYSATSKEWTGGIVDVPQIYTVANADLMTPGLQDKMPAGVRVYGSLPVYVDVDRSTLGNKILSRLSAVPVDLLILAIVWLFRRVALTAVGTHGAPGNPFIWANVRRLRIIAALLVLWPVVGTWSSVAELTLVSQTLNEFSMLEWDTNGLALGFGMGFVLAVLAEVFAAGIRLQEEVEGLV
ncbi:MAG TPA: DUF2975 domain-containing protein [Terriglobia bacterium]|nr:DUF2975 domain-containing protein [Terriglobia bacterium]